MNAIRSWWASGKKCAKCMKARQAMGITAISRLVNGGGGGQAAQSSQTRSVRLVGGPADLHGTEQGNVGLYQTEIILDPPGAHFGATMAVAERYVYREQAPGVFYYAGTTT